MKQLTPVMTSVLLLCASTAVADVYKCLDADGAVQFRDTPCGSSIRSLRRLDEAVPESAIRQERMQKTRRLVDAMRDERLRKEQQAKEEKEKREQRRKECINARDNLRRRQEARAFYELDESGNRIILPDSEREAVIARARKSVEDWCD